MDPSTSSQRAVEQLINVVRQQLSELRTPTNGYAIWCADMLITEQVLNLVRVLRSTNEKRETVTEKPAVETRPVGAGAGEPSTNVSPSGGEGIPTTLARTVTGLGYEPSVAPEETA